MATTTNSNYRDIEASRREPRGRQRAFKKAGGSHPGGFVGNIVKHLKKGERIRIGGLGILQVRKRAARMGRNPGHRRTDPDQSQQESRLPRLEGTQGGGLIASGR